MQKFTISKADSGQTAVKYLSRILKEAPSGLLYKQIRKKNITLNEKKMTGSEKLCEGDVISVFMSDETISKFSGRKDLFDCSQYAEAYKRIGFVNIVYEDEHIIICDKPIGVLSQKSEKNDLSINEYLIGYLLNSKKIEEESLAHFKPSVCNRLDRNTGGMILFAKTLFGANILNKCIKERTVSKHYKTIVKGTGLKSERIISFLNKNESLNIVDVIDVEKPGYSKIETAYEPLRENVKLGITELDVELITGKTHQIRAHLSYIGHPIIGDAKYGEKKLNAIFFEKYGLMNQLLYAYKLIFPNLPEYPEISNREFSIDLNPIFDKYIEG